MLKYALVAALFLTTLSTYADVSVPRAKVTAWTTYDVSVNGGQSFPHALGVTMPAGSVITDAWVYINTAFTDSGTGSFALQCAGTRDIMDYNDITLMSMNTALARHLGASSFDASSIIGILATPGAINLASFGSIPTACEVTAVVRGDAGFVPLTAGKATIVLEYFKFQ